MKTDIHPAYSEVNAKCSCGNSFKFKTTLGRDINLDVCDKCHPFYTGTQRVVDTGGRVEKFKNRFGMMGSK
ncbi:MAG: 50S ribosomal protein L31 [Enterovibrio sp.]